MRSDKLANAVRQLRAITETKAPEGRSDGQLLRDFVARRDEVAFEVLMRRHGPMVFGVCMRVLRNVHDAEDAFQGAFVVLARKSATLGQREIVGNWLRQERCSIKQKFRKMAADRCFPSVPMASCWPGAGAPRSMSGKSATKSLPGSWKDIAALSSHFHLAPTVPAWPRPAGTAPR